MLYRDAQMNEKKSISMRIKPDKSIAYQLDTPFYCEQLII